MPEYLAPGVYVEETGLRAPAIPGQETRNAVFLGPAARGPLGRLSPALGSLGEFEAAYGAPGALDFGPGVATTNWLAHAARAFFAEGGRSLQVVRCAGGDGRAPVAGDYEHALQALDGSEGFASVSAPGGARFTGVGTALDDALIRVCAAGFPRRFAVLDAPAGAAPAAVRARLAAADSSLAAVYYPWVVVDDPAGGAPLAVPPSGFVAGIIQRVDTARGVHKAPANEPLRSARHLERDLTSASVGSLTGAHVNCLRDFGRRGILVWGARTLSRDPEWKYVNVRRLAMHLEHSLDAGLHWVVYEANAPTLWSRVRRVIDGFLHAYWLDGALLGATPGDAWFVRCGRDTMTQADVDNGRLRVLVGVAATRPAEFIVLQLERRTA